MKYYLKYTAFTGILLCITGFAFSPALQSIGTAIIFLHPFLNNQIKEIPVRFRENKILWLLPIFYLITFLSIFYTSDYKSFWNQNAILKLPFLLVPIGLCSGIEKKQLKWILYYFIALIWIIASASFINYLFNFQEINAQIVHSKPIPIFTGTTTILSHIYFGVMLAFATCAAFYFSWMEKPVKKWQLWLIKFIFFTFVIYLHSIIARTGLLAFYASAFIIISWLMWRSRNYILGISILGGAILIFALSLFLVPSLNNRLANTQKDINQYKAGKELNHYSISMRMEALKTAWKVYKRSAVFGVGVADIKTEMQAQYQADESPLTTENRKLPHNQFLQTLTMLGIAGFLALLAIFVYPFYRRKILFFTNKFQLLFLAFLVICFFSFQVESVLERQLGVTFFSLFYILLSNRNLAHED